MHDKQLILQAVIDSDQLDKYFHADVLPERMPLRLIKDQWYEEGIHLTKFGQPVQFIPKEDAKGPYFAVPKLDITEAKATVSFRYPPEGIQGNATLAKNQAGWMITSIDIRER